MRKQTKIVAALSATALLALGASAMTFAAGWDNSTGAWRYLDSKGEEVTDAWRKSGDYWFYLDSDGTMATDQIVENDNNDDFYYVNADGAMVTNQWVALENDDDNVDSDYRWYYFGSDGKAYRNKSTNNANKVTKSNIKTINGKKYTFDEDGRMLFGWIQENDLTPITDFSEEDWADADQKSYYFGGADDGSAQSGWFQLTVNHPDKDDDETFWFWGDSNGKVQKDGSKTINGVKYYFDQFGAMVDGFVDTGSPIASATNASKTSVASDIVYVNGDGGSRKNQWIWAIPDEEWLESDYQDDEYSWFYAKSNGKLTTDQIKKINSKYYVFDSKGRMLYGIVADLGGQYARLSQDDFDGTAFAQGDIGTSKEWRTGTGKVYFNFDGADIYYFSGDEKADGSRKNGYVNVEFADDTYQMYFNTSTGKAYNNYVSKIKKFVRNGIVLKANTDENNYVAVDATYDGTTYTLNSGALDYSADLSVVGKVLVNSSGNIQKKVQAKKDSNDVYYWTNANGVIEWVSDVKLKKKSSSSTATTVFTDYNNNEWIKDAD